jgi:uncharacterized protein
MAVPGLTVSSRTYPSADQSKATLILAHGAGAGQLHPFMVGYANALAALGVDVVTFNFPYMDAKRRVPDAAAVLENCYRTVIGAVRRDVASAGRALFIGGKSMGGRIATQLAAADASLPLSGLVLLGYPLHPPGRPDKRRDAHLPHVGRPALFVQGSRDTFGTPAELQPALDSMSPAPTLLVVEGGDHSFKVSGGAHQQTVSAARVQQTIAEWIGRVAI